MKIVNDLFSDSQNVYKNFITIGRAFGFGVSLVTNTDRNLLKTFKFQREL